MTVERNKRQCMFEIGKTYTLRILEPGTPEGPQGYSIVDHHNMKAVDIAVPLVKFSQFGELIVINTTSATFVWAKAE